MKRRDFLVASCVAGVGAVSGIESALGAEAVQERARRGQGGQGRGGRYVYELKQYILESKEQQNGLLEFLGKAMIPALNRLGIEKVGVFVEKEERDTPTVYVLVPHRMAWSVFSTTSRLMSDEQFLKDGEAFLNAGNENRTYKRIKTAILLAFEGMVAPEVPSTKDTRVFQLRTYESPTVKTGQKKIEMFNTAEIAIFRKTGLNPVFFGEAIAGDNLPNLTYMLGFDNEEAQKAGWQAFGKHPDWQALRAMPEYADKKILCGITNIVLKPAACSQI
jgi:hypothetical protein